MSKSMVQLTDLESNEDKGKLIIQEMDKVEVDQEPLPETLEEIENNSSFAVWKARDPATIHYKFLLYGTSGSGKTRLASTFPSPLFLDMEGGMQGLKADNVLRLPKDPTKVIETIKELKAAHTLIKNALKSSNPPFRTVILDSLSEMQELVMKSVIEGYTANRQYQDQPTLADYGKAMRDFMAIFRSFLKLPCHVVFTAVTAPKAYAEDQNAPVFVGKKTGPEVCRLVDNIGFTHTVTDDTDTVKYLISFSNTPDHVGKDRLGIGAKSRPNNFNNFFKGA